MTKYVNVPVWAGGALAIVGGGLLVSRRKQRSAGALCRVAAL
jgi:LPXTG-motif cell wall-anchored protein